MSLAKLFQALLSGQSDVNFRYSDLLRLLLRLGFTERSKGGHHIFYREGIDEIINLQPLPGGKAKPYQVKQLRQLVVKYGLELRE